jgi:hypothetical protein
MQDTSSDTRKFMYRDPFDPNDGPELAEDKKKKDGAKNSDPKDR